MSQSHPFFVSTPSCPWPDNDNNQPASHSLIVVDSPDTLSEPTPSKFARQIRRLQFRHGGGFRGLSMTPRAITPPSRTISPCSKKTPPFYEYIPKTERSESIAGRPPPLFGKTRSPSSPLRILQEVDTANTRRRVSQSFSPSPTVLQEISQPCTPEIRAELLETRDILHDKLPSPSKKTHHNTESEPFPPPSPHTPQTPRADSPSKSDTTATEGEETPKSRPRPRTFTSSSEIIEHLEAQLAAANTQLESLVSPIATKARSSKLRALTAETKTLKQEISEWERMFDKKLEEAMAERAHSNARLQARVKNLERELGRKDGRIKELEFELESVTEKVQHVDAVESSNYELEKRLDLMSELLAHSHTKLDLSLGTNSNSSDPPKKSRPTSMLSRMPSSLETPPSSQQSTDSDAEAKKIPLRLRSPNRFTWHEQPAHRLDCTAEQDMNQQRLSIDLESTSSAPLSATTLSSSSSFSRPSSMTSDNSSNSLAFSVPFSPLSETSPKPSQRRRRMRRFHSGSGTKSLILPATTMPHSIPPASAPLLQTPFSERSESDVMPSPTSLGWDSNSPFSTPTQSRPLPPSMVRDDVLGLLEGGPSFEETFSDEERSRNKSPDPVSFTDEEEQESGVSPVRSLMDELTLVGESRVGHSSSAATSAASSTRWRGTNRSSPASSKNSRTRHVSQSYLSQQHARSPIRRHHNGMVAACKLAMSEVCRNPLRLSRAVIQHTWALVTGARTFSDFGLWFLRLLFGPTITRELIGRSRALWQLAGERAGHARPSRPPINSPLSDAVQASNEQRSKAVVRPPILVLSGDVSPQAETADDPRLLSKGPKDGNSNVSSKIPSPISQPEDATKTSYSQKLFMWLKLSAVLTMAIGIAIIDGPAKLFAETDVEATKQERETHEEDQRKASAEELPAKDTKKIL